MYRFHFMFPRNRRNAHPVFCKKSFCKCNLHCLFRTSKIPTDAAHYESRRWVAAIKFLRKDTREGRTRDFIKIMVDFQETNTKFIFCSNRMWKFCCFLGAKMMIVFSFSHKPVFIMDPPMAVSLLSIWTQILSHDSSDLQASSSFVFPNSRTVRENIKCQVQGLLLSGMAELKFSVWVNT